MADSHRVHMGHRDRVREKLKKRGNALYGLEGFEILELMLFYALPRRDTAALSHLLIDRFGTVYGSCTAPLEELCSIKPMGEKSAVIFKAYSAFFEYLGYHNFGSGTNECAAACFNSGVCDNEYLLRLFADNGFSFEGMDTRTITQILLCLSHARKPGLQYSLAESLEKSYGNLSAILLADEADLKSMGLNASEIFFLSFLSMLHKFLCYEKIMLSSLDYGTAFCEYISQLLNPQPCGRVYIVGTDITGAPCEDSPIDTGIDLSVEYDRVKADFKAFVGTLDSRRYCAVLKPHIDSNAKKVEKLLLCLEGIMSDSDIDFIGGYLIDGGGRARRIHGFNYFEYVIGEYD